MNPDQKSHQVTICAAFAIIIVALFFVIAYVKKGTPSVIGCDDFDSWKDVRCPDRGAEAVRAAYASYRANRSIIMYLPEYRVIYFLPTSVAAASRQHGINVEKTNAGLRVLREELGL